MATACATTLDADTAYAYPASIATLDRGRTIVTGFNRILAPLDGSARAEAALSWLHVLPARHVRLLRVCEEHQPDDSAAAQYLAEVAARLRPPEAEIEIRVANGGPAETIVGDATDCDLIVMCTQGAGDGGRLLYGSVADRVARHSPVPTLLLRGGRDPVTTVPLHRIVVPLDGSAAAERALALATKLAGTLQVPLHLVSVHDPLPAVTTEPRAQRRSGTDNAGLDLTDAYLKRTAAALRVPGASVSTEVRSGVPAMELPKVGRPGDLLVITTHGSGAARRWQIGRVAEKLLRHAAAPLVLVRVDSR